MSIIQHDVRRLDRLISDISDASRLDAELARADAEPVDMQQAARRRWSRVANERAARARSGDHADDRAGARRRDAFLVLGHDSRLGQVFNNLIDNARSFSPPDEPCGFAMRRAQERGRDPGRG